MAFRFLFRGRTAVPAVPIEEPSPSPSEPVPVVPPASGLSGALQAVWEFLVAVFSALDRGLCWFAVPFGAFVADPWRRYAILLGVYAGIYLVGALPVPGLPLVALAIGYVGVLAVGRAWVLNEKHRIAIAKKLEDADPDEMPDLRGTALTSALQLVVLFPLLFMQLQRHFGLYKVGEATTFLGWLWFSIDKTYLKALPDWSILYGVHISSIEFDSAWGRHLVLLSRLTFDWILIQGALRLLAIRTTIQEGVAAIKADPEIAVRIGRRAIPALVEKLSDPDKAVRGAAANALMQLGDEESIRRIGEAAGKAASPAVPPPP